MKIISFFTT